MESKTMQRSSGNWERRLQYDAVIHRTNSLDEEKIAKYCQKGNNRGRIISGKTHGIVYKVLSTFCYLQGKGKYNIVYDLCNKLEFRVHFLS